MSLGNKALSLGALAIALTAMAGCAGGPKGPPRGEPGMAMRGAEAPSIITRPGALLLAGLDRDGDFSVSAAEAERGGEQQFVHADANGDAQISPLEFAAWSSSALGTADSTPGRLSFDASSDGMISRSEFVAGIRALFAQFDADKNGVVARNEMVERLTLPDREGPKMGGGPSMGGGGPGQGQAQPPSAG